MRSYSRIGIYDGFLEIAIESYFDYRKNRKLLDEIVSEGGVIVDGIFFYHREDDWDIYNDSITKDIIKIVISLATYIEAYIYDFSCIGLGDSYTEKHISKLDTVSKWVIVPKLVTGNEIDKGKAYFEGLKYLIKWRNYIVHFKTMEYDSSKKVDFKPLYEMIDVARLFIMLKELFVEMDKIDNDGFHLMHIKRAIRKIKELIERNEP